MSLVSRILTGAVALWLIAYFWPFGAGDPAQVVAIEPPGPDIKPLYPRPALPGERPTHAIDVAPQKPPPHEAVAARLADSKSKPTPSPQPDDKTTAEVAAAPPTPKPSQPGDKPNAARTAALEKKTAALEKKDVVTTTPPAKPKLFYRVIVRDGDTIEADGVVITLGGIKARDTDEKCKDGTGRTWPCGVQARTALTRLIHGRAVACAVPGSGQQKALTTRCKVGRIDLSIWMVTQGWAEPTPPKDPRLADAAQAAQKKKLGIWR